MIPANDPDRIIHGCLDTPAGRDALLSFIGGFNGVGHVVIDPALIGGQYYVHAWSAFGQCRIFVSSEVIARFGDPVQFVAFLTGVEVYAMECGDFEEYAAAHGGADAALQAIADAILTGKPLAELHHPSPQVRHPLPEGGPEMN